MQIGFGNWFFLINKTPNLFQIKFKIKVSHLHNKRSSTFSISDHLSSTSLAKLKYFGISCSPRLKDSYCEYTSEASSLRCPWKVLLGGFRVHKDFRVCNLNNNFMAEDDVGRCCRLHKKISRIVAMFLQQQKKKEKKKKKIILRLSKDNSVMNWWIINLSHLG